MKVFKLKKLNRHTHTCMRVRTHTGRVIGQSGQMFTQCVKCKIEIYFFSLVP